MLRGKSSTEKEPVYVETQWKEWKRRVKHRSLFLLLLLACFVTFHNSCRLNYLLCESEKVILLCLPHMDVIMFNWCSFYLKELCKLENSTQILIVICDLRIAFWPNTRIIINMFKKEIINYLKTTRDLRDRVCGNGWYFLHNLPVFLL